MVFEVRDWTGDQVANPADLAAAVSTELGLGMDIAEPMRVAGTCPTFSEQFWRASPVCRHGAGLGLTFCQGIVEALGDRIWAESQVGEGATFYFMLPFAS